MVENVFMAEREENHKQSGLQRSMYTTSMICHDYGNTQELSKVTVQEQC
jgi:hypothetical protein